MKKYISIKPRKCQCCGSEKLISRMNSWQCKNCGKHHGKSVAKVTVDREICGKKKLIASSVIRPDGGP